MFHLLLSLSQDLKQVLPIHHLKILIQILFNNSNNILCPLNLQLMHLTASEIR
jgi:hypothetical protein